LPETGRPRGTRRQHKPFGYQRTCLQQIRLTVLLCCNLKFFSTLGLRLQRLENANENDGSTRHRRRHRWVFVPVIRLYYRAGAGAAA
jgi:hypothetical protein